MLRSDRVHLRLFVQGVECPIGQCTVSTAVMPTATIVVLPTHQLREIIPGSQVVVAYLDPDGAPPVTSAPKSNYSLLFNGYVRSVTETHAAAGRGATLQCDGDITLLERFQTYFFDTGGDLLSRKKNFVGASKFHQSITHQTATIGTAIAQAFELSTEVATPGFANSTGIVRGVVALLERAIGVSKGRDFKPAQPDAADALNEVTNDLAAQRAKESDAKSHGHYAQHDFFAIMDAQTHILYQLGGLSQDLSAFAVLREAISQDVVAQLGDQVHGLVDLLTLSRIIIGRAYHGMYAVSTARAVPPVVTLNAPLLPQIRADIVPSGALADTAQAVLGGLFSLSSLADAQRILRELIEPPLQGPRASVVSLLSAPAQVWYRRTDETRRVLLDEELLRVAVSNIELTDGWDGALNRPARMRAEADLLAVVNVLAAAQAGDVAVEESAPRVLTSLIMPDLFFSTPPTCNVLFPNQISNLSYRYAGMDRPTRLMLYVDPGNLQQEEGDVASVVVKTYYAPQAELFATSQGQLKLTTPDELPPLLQHERYTGIVPLFHNITKLDTIKAANAQRISVNDDVIYLRMANFQLMDARYRSGQLSVSGPFNPFACPGFPCAVMDSAPNDPSPRVYVGLLQSVAHDVSSTNASTSYTITHARLSTDVDDVFKIADPSGAYSAEDMCRPIWYDDQYSLANIGQALYQTLLGCGSVQDSVPQSEPFDTKSYEISTKVDVPTHKTSTALAFYLRTYGGLQTRDARLNFVHSYVRRPVADLNDVIGPRGLYSWVSAPQVADAQGDCPPGRRPAHGTHGASRAPVFDPLVILEDKRGAARRYAQGARKAAFR